MTFYRFFGCIVLFVLLAFSSDGLARETEKKKTLSHQFNHKIGPKLTKNSIEVQSSDQTTKEYFESLGHRYKNPLFRASQQSKGNNNSKNRQLAQRYLATLGHKFSTNGSVEIVQGKRLNDEPLLDDNASGFLENEELLLIAQVNEHVLDTVFGYKSGNGAMIGLDNLFAVIDFPIIVDVDNRRASGWFINESQRFELVVPSDETTPASVSIGNKTYQIPRHLIRVDDDDIYLHSDYLSDLFNIGFKINFKDLLLLITPSQLLPLEEKLRRRARLGKLSIGKLLPPQLPFRNTPYKAFSTPLVDVQANYSVNQDANRASYSLVGMGDLAYMTGSYFLSGSDDDVFDNFRLNLQRESITNDLLGPLKASRIAVGDISPTNVALIKGSAQEVGFKLSNREVGVNNNTNTTSFVGDLLPGWDIELYHNNVLLETTTVDESGRYEFRDLDLSFGENNFKMIFYGPQGQKRERLESIPVTTNTLLERQLTYDFSMTKQNSSLFNKQNSDLPLIDSYRTAIALEQGINNDISLQSGFSSYQFRNGERHSFVPFGINYFLPIAKFNLGYVKDIDAGSSLELSAKSRWNKHAIDLRFQQFDEDFAIDSHFDSNTKNNIGVRVSGPLTSGSGLALNYALNGGKSTSYNDIDTSVLNLFLGAFTNEFSVTNTLSYTDISIANNADIETFNGTAQFTKTFDNLRWRSRVNYDLKPSAEFTNASTSLFWAMSPTLSSEFGLQYNKNATRASYAINWDTENAIVSANFSADDNDAYQAFLSVRFSFGQDPTSGSLKLARDRMAASGGISARVFEDLNLDGIYNDGEPLIKGAKLVGVHARRDAISQDTGIAFLTGLPSNRITDIQLDVDSLEDPFWVPMEKGISFLPRPGAVETLDIPVVTAGEIEGTISISRRGNAQKPGRYITLQILDEYGNVVQETDSEYDGFYLFSAVTPGRYTVVIHPDYLKNNELLMNENGQATIYGDGTVVRGIDFLLKTHQIPNTEVQTDVASDNKKNMINLGSFSSPFNQQITYQLLVKRYPSLRLIPVFDNTQRLILGPMQSPDLYRSICQQIMATGLHCAIE